MNDLTPKLLYTKYVAGESDWRKPQLATFRIDLLESNLFPKRPTIDELTEALTEARAMMPADQVNEQTIKFGGNLGYDRCDPSTNFYMHVEFSRMETEEEAAARVALHTQRLAASRAQEIAHARAVLASTP